MTLMVFHIADLQTMLWVDRVWPSLQRNQEASHRIGGDMKGVTISIILLLFLRMFIAKANKEMKQ